MFKQWTTFSRVWYLFDAKWQDPIECGKVLSKYLMGKVKYYSLKIILL
jgi:large subunit ribosomal protein L13